MAHDDWSMMTGVLNLPFDAYPQPEWNTPETVVKAFEEVERAGDDDSVWRAYNSLLYALGNNHAGTYYPVVLAIAPRAAAVLRGSNPWAHHAMVEIIICLLVTFEPEPGFETYQGEAVPPLLWREMLALKPEVETIARREGPACNTAQELLEVFEEGPDQEAPMCAG